VNGQPLHRISRSDLDNLMTTLEVSFVKLAECLVSPGRRLALGGIDAYGIHYNMGGSGRMIVGNQPPINLVPHTLVVLPRQTPFVVEGPNNLSDGARWSTVQGSQTSFPADALHKFVAGEARGAAYGAKPVAACRPKPFGIHGTVYGGLRPGTDGGPAATALSARRGAAFVEHAGHRPNRLRRRL